jgi:hypothetical protein
MPALPGRLTAARAKSIVLFTIICYVNYGADHPSRLSIGTKESGLDSKSARKSRVANPSLRKSSKRSQSNESCSLGLSRNPDGYLDQLSTRFAEQLAQWATNAHSIYTGPGCLDAGEHGPISTIPGHRHHRIT